MTQFRQFILLGLTLIFLLSGCHSAKMSTADESMACGDYFKAANEYRQIYRNLKNKSDRPLRAETAFKMGLAYLKLSRYENAASAFSNAIRYGYSDSTATLLLAQSLHASGLYRNAIDAYSKSNSELSIAGLAGAAIADSIMRHPTRHKVTPATFLNTRRSEFSPVIFNRTLYFTSNNENSRGSQKSPVTGQKYGDIWTSRKDENGRWTRPTPIEGEINTDADEGCVSFSPDGSTMYFSRVPSGSSVSSIFTSKRYDATWSEPEQLFIASDSIHSYAYPSVSPSGEWLYFTSDRPGCGSKDIWRMNLYSLRGAIENLGNDINTSGDEMFPSALSDSAFIFSSNGHPGLGGLDMFRADLLPNGRWHVVNLGYPLNSKADDFGMTFDSEASATTGFFSSGRDDARGYDNIYSFVLPEINVEISGTVTDFDEYPISGATIRIVGNDGSIRKTLSHTDGTFHFPLSPTTHYIIFASSDGYLNAHQEFTTDPTERDEHYDIAFRLASLTKPNVIENIFYDFDRATLRPESREALDALVKMLGENPEISIEMSSHTDRIGSDSYNLDLSNRRAKAVVDYLIEAGIAPDRLQYTGYGKSRPKKVSRKITREYHQFSEGTILDEQFLMTLSDDDRQIADQINRRTEFTVISVEYGQY